MSSYDLDTELLLAIQMVIGNAARLSLYENEDPERFIERLKRVRDDLGEKILMHEESRASWQRCALIKDGG